MASGIATPLGPRRLLVGSASRRQMLVGALKISDSTCIFFSFVAAAVVANYQPDFGSLEGFLAMRLKLVNVALFLGMLLAFRLVFDWMGMYDPLAALFTRRRLQHSVLASVLTVPVVALSGVVFQISIVTRDFILVYAPLVVLGALIPRIVFRVLFSVLGKQSGALRNIVIIGSGPRALRAARNIEVDPEDMGSIVGFCDHEWSGSEEFRATGRSIVTDPKNFRSFARDHVIDEIVIAVPWSVLGRVEEFIIPACEELGITVRFLGSILSGFRSSEEDFSDQVLVSVYPGTIDGWSSVAKRTVDIVLGTVILTAALPVFAAASLAIACDSRGPVLYSQIRVGRNKRLFRMYKFRSMDVDAEQGMAELEVRNEAEGPVFKIRNDPRVTRVGRWLRKTSIDELPQLINVMSGSMSLVGPRPLPIRDFEGFDSDRYRRRFSVVPGLTGLWQVSGRNETSFEDWMELDLEYIDKSSLALDLKILLRTIPAVLRRTGAY